jgi:hypothetical protein
VKETPEEWRTDSWFLLNHAPAHRSVLVKDSLAKNNVATLQRPSYSPDLVAADSYVFPVLQSAPKKRRFCDATDIKNAT